MGVAPASLKVLVVAYELVADKACATPAWSAMAEPVGARRMKAQPDGNLFLAEHVDGQQKPAQVLPEVLTPFFADVIELAGDGIGRGEHGRAQRVEQAADFGRERRPRAQIVREGRGYLLVDGPLGKLLVFEELAEGCKGGISVGKPQQHELFQRGLAVRQAVGGAFEPFGGGELALIDGDVREVLDECQEQAVKIRRLDLF